MTEPVSRTGLTMNPKTSMVLLLVGRLVSIVTAGSPASGESLLHVSYLYVSLPFYQSVHLPVCLYALFLSACCCLSLYLSICLPKYLCMSLNLLLCLSVY